MPKEYKGDEFLFLVEVETTGGNVLSRPFNQQDGSRSIEADEIDLSTKDKKGSDYGDVSETTEFSGILTEDDPFPKYMRTAIRQKKMISITEVNTRTLEAERGSYMATSFEQSYSNGEFATYSLSASLNGDIEELTMVEADIPDGAPTTENQATV